MGGGYYDRDVGSTGSSADGYDYGAYSDDAAKAMGSSAVSKALLPRDRSLTCDHKNPLVVAIDVTGSMGDWSKIIWDKMPMFFGQIMVQGYLPDPAISFAAVGDVECDKAPLQICDFAQGNALDEWLKQIWLEGGGGGNLNESYDVVASFYAQRCTLTNPELPLFFITGDEHFHERTSAAALALHLGKDFKALDSRTIFDELRKKFRVYHIHKPYSGTQDPAIVAQWQKALGEDHVLLLQDPKAVIDVMLGVIAIEAKSRDLDGYLLDMKTRGQTDDRIALVQKVLEPVEASRALVKVDTAALATAKGKGPNKRASSKKI